MGEGLWRSWARTIPRMKELLGDPLGLASIVALLVVGLVAVVDLAGDGKLDPAVLALVVAVVAPLTPALISRYSATNGKPRPTSTAKREE